MPAGYRAIYLGASPRFSSHLCSSQYELANKYTDMCRCIYMYTYRSTEGPSWGHQRLVLGAIGSLLEPFCRHVLPKVDKLCSKLTFGIPPRRALSGSPPHPGVELRANLKSISHRCRLFEVAFVWELTKQTILLPLGCLQGGSSASGNTRSPEVVLAVLRRARIQGSWNLYHSTLGSRATQKREEVDLPFVLKFVFVGGGRAWISSGRHRPPLKKNVWSGRGLLG